MSSTVQNDVISSCQTNTQPTLGEAEKIAQIAQHFSSIMGILGLDLRDDSLKKTPNRVARMYVQELFSGLNPANKPTTTLFDAPEGYKSVILEKDIQFFSCCEHHFVPIQGIAHVAYLPDDKIIGISKINRIVHYYARRPQLQERLTHQIAAEMRALLHTEDVAVCIEAVHFCVISRGVSDINSKTYTSYLGGKFNENPLRSELLTQTQRS